MEPAEISGNSVDEAVSPTPLIASPLEFPQCSDDMNISENILSTYNISCNMSTINLVGSNVVASVKTAQLEDHSSGYCRMVPIFTDVAKEYEQPVQMPIIYPRTPTDESVDIKKAITFDRGDNVVDSLRILSICTPQNRHSGSSTENIEPPQQHPAATPKEVIYANITTKETPLTLHNSQSSRKRLKGKNLFLCSRSPSNQSSNDEKYPSYYPNTSPTTPDAPTVLTTKKSPQAVRVRSHHHQTPRTENVYIATPHTKSSRKSPPSYASSTNKVQVKSRYRGSSYTPTSTNKTVTPKASAIRNISIQIEPDPNNRHINSNSLIVMNAPGSGDGDNNVAAQTPNRLYQKYATHTRISPIRRAASNSTEDVVTPIPTIIDDAGSTGLAASLKRFRSMPRFRGIDFSPLKLRINNVLQRYNSDNI